MKTSIIRILAACLAAVTIVTALPACGNTAEPPSESSDTYITTEASEEGFVLIKDGKSEYRFVRPARGSNVLIKYISSFYRELTDKYPDAGFKLKSDFLSDGEHPYEKEILLGKTNRDGADGFRAEIPENCFAISVSEDLIRIDGTSDWHIKLALDYFYENCIKEDENGNIIIPIGTYISEPAIAAIKDKISNKGGFTTKSKIIFEVPALDGHRIMQGGCTDGKYLYLCMVNSGDTQKAYVHKYDAKTYELVKVSKEIPTDHSNDATYNPNTNEIIICHNAPNRQKITVIDADTLEFKKTISISFKIFSIAYQPERDVYVIGISGGQDFTVLDSSLKVAKDYVKSGDRFTANSTGYTTQGVECDEDYIYFVQYNTNVIMVYDWSGNYINRFDLDIPANTEPENISIVGDKFYIACNNPSWTGGLVYETELITPAE